MKEVKVAAKYDASTEDVWNALSPRTLIEYQGTFTVTSIIKKGDRWEVIAETEEIDTNLNSVFVIQQTDRGYEIKQGEEGVFDERYTEITIEPGEDCKTVVTARTEFTFGGLFAALKDRYIATIRRQELESLLIDIERNME
jgi:hypothetical protein